MQGKELHVLLCHPRGRGTICLILQRGNVPVAHCPRPEKKKKASISLQVLFRPRVPCSASLSLKHFGECTYKCILERNGRLQCNQSWQRLLFSTGSKPANRSKDIQVEKNVKVKKKKRQPMHHINLALVCMLGSPVRRLCIEKKLLMLFR